jgi:hypothetical protein
MAGCGGCGGTNYTGLGGRMATITYTGSSWSTLCQNYDDTNMADWLANTYTFPDIVTMPWGDWLEAVFSTNSEAPDSSTLYGPGYWTTWAWRNPQGNVANTIRNQYGLGSPWPYMIIEFGLPVTTNGDCTAKPVFLRACTASGGPSWWTGISQLAGLYPLDLGVPATATTDCSDGCAMDVGRIFNPINFPSGYEESVSFVPDISTIAEFVTAMRDNGLTPYGPFGPDATYGPHWDATATCNGPLDDPFDDDYA